MIEYQFDSHREEEFRRVLEELREIRLRDGALRWDLFFDAERPNCCVETFLVESWIEHLRQHERVTVAETMMIQERILPFLVDAQSPKVTHLIAHS